MKYSTVHGEKTEAFPGGRGVCDCCGRETIARCGRIKINHWAHSSQKHCDPWWENETEWHRTWKSYFPKDWQEVVHFDASGEMHKADIKTPDGLVIEFQNSPISLQEIESREMFYQKMVWVVNGDRFVKNFSLTTPLPDPQSKFLDDIEFIIGKRNIVEGFYRPSSQRGPMAERLSLDEISEQIKQNYFGHHLYKWTRPRDVWYTAKCPVYFDFNRIDGLMFELIRYRGSFFCVRLAGKNVFRQRVKGNLPLPF